MLEKEYTPDTDEYMFRYLEKYVGKYRVLTYYDLIDNTFPKDESFEDFYIPCKRNCVIKHTYEGNDILALCFYDGISTAKKVLSELKMLGVEVESDIESGNRDAIILFNDKDMKIVASVVKPKTSGKTINPLSKRNLPKSKIAGAYKIPQEDLDKLNKKVEHLSQTDKMQFFRSCNKEYIEKISKKDKCDYNTQMKNDGLNARQFIHSIDKWDDYLKFVNNKLKNKG